MTQQQFFEHENTLFIDELFWPTPPNNKSLDLLKLKDELALKWFVKLSVLGTTNYGVSKELLPPKGKKMVAMGAFLLNLYQESFVDLIIVAKLDETRAAVIAIKNSHVIPHGGDKIEDINHIHGYVLQLIEQFHIGNIWSIGFGRYFYDDRQISAHLASINPNFVPMEEETDEHDQPLATVWEYSGVKRALRKSTLRKIPDNARNKYILLAAAVILIVLMGVIAKMWLFSDDEETTVVVPGPPPPPPLPNAIAAVNFINSCFSGTNSYFGFPGGWQLDSFSCTLKDREAHFSSVANQANDLIIALGRNDLIFADVGAASPNENQSPHKQTATLKESLKPNYRKVNYPSALQERREKLESLKNMPGVELQLAEQQDSKSAASEAFILSSQFSPLWLYSNHYLDGVLLMEVSAIYNPEVAFYNWKIAGQIGN